MCLCNEWICALVKAAIEKQGFLINDMSFHGPRGVTRREKEQQIEISVGADESETRICRPINFYWSKVHAISPMLCDNEFACKAPVKKGGIVDASVQVRTLDNCTLSLSCYPA